MSEQKWEYCELGLAGHKEHKAGLMGGKTGSSYNCFIRYFGMNESEFRQLSELDKPLPFNPFNKTMALLGNIGWELVSVQHANVAEAEGYGGEIRWHNCVAYFKRQSQPGRAVNQPALVL